MSKDEIESIIGAKIVMVEKNEFGDIDIFLDNCKKLHFFQCNTFAGLYVDSA